MLEIMIGHLTWSGPKTWNISEGEIRKTEWCNTHPCLIIIDCQWFSWSKSGPCSKSCGEGEQVFLRSHLREAKNGGQPCTGLSHKIERCNENSCPSSSNNFFHRAGFYKFFLGCNI